VTEERRKTDLRLYEMKGTLAVNNMQSESVKLFDKNLKLRRVSDGYQGFAADMKEVERSSDKCTGK